MSLEKYISQKNDILDKCLRLTEDIYSSLNDWEKPAKLLQERMAAINELVTLESSAGDSILKTCPKSEAQHLDDKLKLILNLDKLIGEAIQKAQNDVLASMKYNIQEQKLMLFEMPVISESGRYFDEKQ